MVRFVIIGSPIKRIYYYNYYLFPVKLICETKHLLISSADIWPFYIKKRNNDFCGGTKSKFNKLPFLLSFHSCFRNLFSDGLVQMYFPVDGYILQYHIKRI